MDVESSIYINIKDYLSEERIREIAEEEVRNSFRSQARNEADVERVLSNLGYEFVYKLCKEEWNVDLSEKLKKQMHEIIEGDKCHRVEYTMFSDGAYGREEGPAKAIVNEECRNMRPLIKAEIEERIKAYPFHELDKGEITDTICETILNKLFGKEDET